MIATVFTTVFDPNLGVVFVAATFLFQRQVIPPFRKDSAGKMIVQVAAFWHVVQDPIQILGTPVGSYVIKPVSMGNLHDEKNKKESTDVYHAVSLIGRFCMLANQIPFFLVIVS